MLVADNSLITDFSYVWTLLETQTQPFTSVCRSELCPSAYWRWSKEWCLNFLAS